MSRINQQFWIAKFPQVKSMRTDLNWTELSLKSNGTKLDVGTCYSARSIALKGWKMKRSSQTCWKTANDERRRKRKKVKTHAQIFKRIERITIPYANTQNNGENVVKMKTYVIGTVESAENQIISIAIHTHANANANAYFKTNRNKIQSHIHRDMLLRNPTQHAENKRNKLWTHRTCTPK